MKQQLLQGFGLGQYRVHPPSRTIVGPDGSRHVQARAMEVLLVLAATPGEVIEREQFGREVWGGRPVGRDALTHCISELRHALGDHAEDPRIIQTIPGRGYRLITFPTFGENPETLSPGVPPDATGTGLFAELRKRKVFRVAGLYLVTAWLLIQVAGETFVPLGLPEWTVRTVIVALLMGFPVAVMLAWAFDIRREPRSRRLLDVSVMLAAVVAVGLIVAVVLTDLPPGPPPTPANSIAVMPFVNLSPDDSYFSDGLSEEIINRLTQSRKLKVSSRTDSFQYADQGIRTISSALDVRHVLEGSVQRDGEDIRVTARLINTDSGFEMWSERFNRQLADIFQIQDDIAKRVAQQLQLVISAAALPDPPDNIDAYDLYLRGRAMLRGPGSDRSAEQAEALFKEALVSDPGYADAYAGLCETYLSQYEHKHDSSRYNDAKSACDNALRRNPGSSSVRLALGTLYRVSGQYRKAHRQFSKLISLNPYDVDAYAAQAINYADQRKFARARQTLARTLEIQPTYLRGYLEMGNVLFRSDQYQQAIPYYEQVIRQDPDNIRGLNNLGSAFFLVGRFDDATSTWRRSLALEPSRTAFSNVGSSLFFEGHFEEAAAMYREAVALAPSDFEMYGNLAGTLLALGRIDEAETHYRKAVELAEQVRDINPRDAYNQGLLGIYYAALGRSTEAVESIRLARQLAPNDMYMHYEAGVAYVLLGEFDAARNAIENAVRLGYPQVLVDGDAALAPITN